MNAHIVSLKILGSLVAVAALSTLSGCMLEARTVPARTVYVEPARTVYVAPSRAVYVEPTPVRRYYR